MAQVNCPICLTAISIDRGDLNVEWECPSCDTPFTVREAADGSLQIDANKAKNGPSSGLTPEQPSGKIRMRRRNSARHEVPTDNEQDLNISLPPQMSFQERFPDLKPAQPPSLFTINGVGIAMYGSRDFDEATGTYVTSACLVVIFIPIFIIGSYRVANAPAEGWFSSGGWHVLGKVPLSPLAKGWNWSMVALIVLGFLLLMFAL